MTNYDVFNGDADGICALLQLRLANPIRSELITGVKRDIKLLSSINPKAEDEITVLDISMDKNKNDLNRILEQGTRVFYCDHHVAGDIPESENLEALINTAPDICTSLLINGYLKSQYAKWAIVGAFGDNLKNSANALASTLSLSESDRQQLESLGIYINYNGYGESLDDLHFTPQELFTAALNYGDPHTFIQDDKLTFEKLEQGYHNDMSQAKNSEEVYASDSASVYRLPNEKWARRVSGVFGNELANQNPERAHAVLTEKPDNTYLVSVRAPLSNKTDADTVCMAFPTGGGRKAAAGINALPADLLDDFLNLLSKTYAS